MDGPALRSALNLNVHYHILFLDSVYAEYQYVKQRFHRVKAPTHSELNALVHTLSHRIARCLEKRGLLERDAESGQYRYHKFPYSAARAGTTPGWFVRSFTDSSIRLIGNILKPNAIRCPIHIVRVEKHLHGELPSKDFSPNRIK